MSISSSVGNQAEVIAGTPGECISSRIGRTRASFEETKRRAARLVDQIADGLTTGRAVADRLAELEARRVDLETELATIDAAAAGQLEILHPRAAEAYKAKVAAIHEVLALGPEGLERDEARAAFRGLVRAIKVTPLEGRGHYQLSMSGDAADLLRLSSEEATGGPELGHRWVRGQDLNL